MRILQVEDFSCIQQANIEIDRLTVIIGPQASGKSVLAKLCFFANDVSQSQQNSLLRSESYEKFTQSIKSRFVEWFPIEAWGSKKFKITYSAGHYSLSLVRKSYKNKVADDFRIKFSEEFKATYEELLAQVSKRESKISDPEVRDELERDWRLRELISNSYKKLQGKDAVEFQAFVPAGRSFFTSIGKAIAVFEQSRALDPLILRFGRLFTLYKDRQRRYFNENSSDREVRKSIEAIMGGLLGGQLQKDGDREYVLTPDGRKVPLTALSSGQQELLPIVTFLPWFSGTRGASLCYIEEPEAHLFPETQSHLVQALVTIAGGSSLVMTTHSPYVLTKINNLLKAGSLSRRLSEPLRKELEALIPRRAWLNARHVRAYAIRDGVLCPLIGKDGFVDGDYLDEISSDLSREFSSMLELEGRHAQ